MDTRLSSTYTLGWQLNTSAESDVSIGGQGKSHDSLKPSRSSVTEDVICSVCALMGRSMLSSGVHSVAEYGA